jgi:O-methyltransferase involved in polyketide biosynthesis
MLSIVGEAVHLTAEKETLLLTLYGKALDSRLPGSILHDTFADDVVHKIDFDFGSLSLPRGGEVSLPVRAKHLDGWTREFLAAHPRANVLHLGCGLDSRVFRIDPSPPGDDGVRWYDVDYPEVIALRRKLYPARAAGYETIGSSVTALRWLDGVAADRPTLVVAEGLLVYLRRDDGLALLRALTARFPSGEIIFDAPSRAMTWLTSRLRAFKKTGAVMHWGIDDPRALEREVPRLRLVDDVPFLTMPELMEHLQPSAMQRLVYRLLGGTRFYRTLVRHLRYRF